MAAAEECNMTLTTPRLSSGRNMRVPKVVLSARPRQDIPPDHVLLRVDRFGFSANNVTYQALGEHPHFRYFDFHSLPESDEVSVEQDGVIPVWGFATVIRSSHPKISVGERVYGYLAPTRFLLLPVSTSDVNKYAFYVPRPHLPRDRRPYNQILRCSSDPQYIPNPYFEDLTMLYRPLFWTAFWCEDWLATSKYRGGASTVLISSASSKTAFCLAYLIHKRDRTIKVVGLTSPKNIGFTKGLGLYDEVLEYDSLTTSPLLHSGERWIYVDVAGNKDFNRHVYDHFASPYTPTLAAVVSLGLTNLSPSTSSASHKWSESDFSVEPSSQPTSAFWPVEENFFMPEWLNVRRRQLDVRDIFSMQQTAWMDLMDNCTEWVEVERVYGAEAVKDSYKSIVTNSVSAKKGLIWSLWDSNAPVAYPTKL
ncbi:hypothetical protein CYLTODRAFT_492180 [Cylindrobasidium torrendii FP15055 ss-10]|uniref:Uncharacterized protein n=1 Tax=Cylindrobasidium torrendii FP15055 ss-10 TaxID=1314674 RepID=A0A0D7B5Y8_9AGAR|nr:hypothetical protein CYLTODRAFT_492180 [Cylindrobasidium torrendii FP15055 ss-10]